MEPEGDDLSRFFQSSYPWKPGHRSACVGVMYPQQSRVLIWRWVYFHEPFSRRPFFARVCCVSNQIYKKYHDQLFSYNPERSKDALIFAFDVLDPMIAPK